MLDQIGSDSSPDDGRLNLNYSNALVSYSQPVSGVGSVKLPLSIGIIAGAETNLMRWRPLDFFLAASDQMLRLYSSNWYGLNGANYRAFTNNFAVTAPITITNIPVWVSNRFVYTPAVHRLLQLAANIYDATTNGNNGNNNLPHVFKPIFGCANNPNHDVYIVGYKEITSVPGGVTDPELAQPYDIAQLASSSSGQTPIAKNGALVNVYGVPWIIGAKKGLPGFNQLSVVNSAQVTRRLQVSRTAYGGRVNSTNQMYLISITNQVGVSFWNSYASNYKSQTGKGLTIYASIVTALNFSNSSYAGNSLLALYPRTYYQTIPAGSPGPGQTWPPIRTVIPFPFTERILRSPICRWTSIV